MLDLLAFKTTDVPAKNIFDNGDFEKDDNGDGLANSYNTSNTIVTSLDDVDFVIGKKSQKLTVNGQDVTLINLNSKKATSTNDIYYHALYVKSSIPDVIVNMYVGSRNDSFSINNTDWQRCSTVRKSEISNFTNIYIKKSTGFNIGDYALFDGHLLINLTETFGAGNEPTVDQMDGLIEQFPNSWFDGTKNLFNAKEFMNNYHKKTKELENAIVSLGGELP